MSSVRSDAERIRDALESDQCLARALNDGSLGGDKDTPYVSDRECSLMRSMKGLGVLRREIADETDRSRATVTRHTSGRCNCDAAVPPTVYTKSGADSADVDWETTRRRRKEWRRDDE